MKVSESSSVWLYTLGIRLVSVDNNFIKMHEYSNPLNTEACWIEYQDKGHTILALKELAI